MIPNGFVRQPEDQLGGNWMKRQLPWSFPQKRPVIQPFPLGPPHQSLVMEKLKSALYRP